MVLLHTISLYSHIIIGCFALIVYWIAAATRKGSTNHKRIGRMFTWAMTLTSWTGMLLSSLVILFPVAIRFANGVPENIDLSQKVMQIQTISGFLFFLSLLVWANTRHATKVLEAKDNRLQLRTPLHIGLLASIWLICHARFCWPDHVLTQLFLFLSLSLLCVCSAAKDF